MVNHGLSMGRPQKEIRDGPRNGGTVHLDNCGLGSAAHRCCCWRGASWWMRRWSEKWRDESELGVLKIRTLQNEGFVSVVCSSVVSKDILKHVSGFCVVVTEIILILFWLFIYDDNNIIILYYYIIILWYWLLKLAVILFKLTIYSEGMCAK